MAKRKDRKMVSLEFAGPATVRQAAEVCERLRKAIETGKPVVLDLAGVSACDLSFVQLVESARVTCSAQDTPLQLAGPAHGAVRDVLERGGFLTGADAPRLDFWTHSGAVQ